MRSLRSWTWRITKGVLVGVVLLLGYLGYIHSTGNFDTVLEGELYRSAQVTPESLDEYVARHGIKSVLNLRGASPGSDWYDLEVAQSTALGLRHADFGLSARREVDQSEAEQLVALMRDLPKPLLIHCRHGSDRTGLAVGLYLAAIAGSDEETAEGALSLYYGHFAVPYLSDAYPMDTSFENLEAWLGYQEDHDHFDFF